jgi:zinc protease
MKTSRWANAAALALLLGAAASGLCAQDPVTATEASRMAKANPPPPQVPKEIDFPAFEQKTLGNGLRVVVVEHHEQPVVSLRLVTRAGQLYEPADKAGLAQMTATLLTEGTESRSSQQIAEAIDQVGGSLGAGVDSDAAYVSALVTADQLGLGLDLLSDVVLRPSFPAEELERQRQQALGGLQIQHESPGYLASAALARALYGEHPYGRPVLGTPDSVQALQRDDLAAFHRSRYVPNASILAVVGDVKPADALARVERAFGGWQKGAEPAEPATKSAEGSE